LNAGFQLSLNRLRFIQMQTANGKEDSEVSWKRLSVLEAGNSLIIDDYFLVQPYFVVLP